MDGPDGRAVRCLSRIQLVCADVERSAAFYEAAFGFSRTGDIVMKTPAFAGLTGLADAAAHVVRLQLGGQTIELAEIEPRGLAYPDDVLGTSSLFQHFAIVVSDMPAAMARLSTRAGWAAISTCGPEQLPASAGGVQAFKFRDPDGHPLELLCFPPDSTPVRWQARRGDGCLGIDHSALSVADTARSIAFYRRLGLTVTGESLNTGREQDRLDGLSSVSVEVTALAPTSAVIPHVELLCYRNWRGSPTPAAVNDVASTRLVLAVAGTEEIARLCEQDRRACVGALAEFEAGTWRALLRDPDGHLIMLEAQRIPQTPDRRNVP
jgi:catechol 2,3-dioxygenase-like lactoylglutathione lyase family enzyme